jgi:hypothetical protein
VLQTKINALVSNKVSEVHAKMAELLDFQRIVAVANEPAASAASSASTAGSMPGVDFKNLCSCRKVSGQIFVLEMRPKNSSKSLRQNLKDTARLNSFDFTLTIP